MPSGQNMRRYFFHYKFISNELNMVETSGEDLAVVYGFFVGLVASIFRNTLKMLVVDLFDGDE